MTPTPRLLVLTGSIGMGKSTTAKMFAELGIPVWDADEAVARLYDVGGAAIPALNELVPDAIRGGKVSRDALRRAISDDPELLTQIEKIIHPLVASDRQEFVDVHPDADLILLDIPLYFETGAKLDAKVLVVTAPEEVQRDRVLSRGTMSEKEFELIKARQIPDAEKRKRADYVIETHTLEQTRRDVHALVETLRTR